MRSRSAADTILPIGKLEPELLKTLLPRAAKNRGVWLGAAVGEDAAVVAATAQIVVTADPVTFATADPGRYAVAVNCNDIVAMGGEPRYFTATVLMPIGSTHGDVQRLFDQLRLATADADIAWIGGHTEVSPTVTATVVCGSAIGVLFERPWSSAGARPGDRVVMTKWVGLEGTTLLAHERPQGCALGEQLEEVRSWLRQPGIDILAEGRALAGLALNAAHDPTEGGVAQGLHEIASSSGMRIRVQRHLLPLRPETTHVCRAFGLDPLGLLASGSLLFTAPAGVIEPALQRLAEVGVAATVVGVVEAGSGVTLGDDSGEHELPHFVQDEVVRALGA